VKYLSYEFGAQQLKSVSKCFIKGHFEVFERFHTNSQTFLEKGRPMMLT